MDGYGTPEQHVERASELGMESLALTEHGNVSSHVRLEKAARKAGIKPIFGVELYTGGVDDEHRSKYKWHLTVLAENQTGYKNLLELVSRGWAEGFYYEPTVSGEMLAQHSEGLVVLSGCAGGMTSSLRRRSRTRRFTRSYGQPASRSRPRGQRSLTRPKSPREPR
jgi:DNA polymerase-3 subunit alpha